MGTYCPDGEVRRVWKHLSTNVEFDDLRIYRENAKRDLDGGLKSAVTVPFDIFSEILSSTNSGDATLVVNIQDSLSFSVGDEITFYDNSEKAYSTETMEIKSISGTTITLDGTWTTPPVANDELCKVTRYDDHIVLGPPAQIYRRAIQMSVYYAKLGLVGGPIPLHDNTVIEFDDAIRWIQRVKEGKDGIEDTSVPHYAYSTHRDYHPITNIGAETGWRPDDDLITDLEEDWDDS